MDVGVVPYGSTVTDISSSYIKPTQISEMPPKARTRSRCYISLYIPLILWPKSILPSSARSPGIFWGSFF